MNLTEFTQQAKPNLRRSVVEPFLADVRALRAAGYSFAQICEYLGSNDVAISVAGLSAYMRRVDSRQAPSSTVEPEPAPAQKPKPQAVAPSLASNPPTTAAPSSAPASLPRKRFEPPPDPMDAVRRVRQQIAREKAASNPPQAQGDSIEPNSENSSSE